MGAGLAPRRAPVADGALTFVVVRNPWATDPDLFIDPTQDGTPTPRTLHSAHWARCLIPCGTACGTGGRGSPPVCYCLLLSVTVCYCLWLQVGEARLRTYCLLLSVTVCYRWARLASAYAKLIAVEERGTAVHRAWIREQHALGEKQPIGFSHFVRWVVAQDPASTHRAWKPISRSCHLGAVQYSHVIYFEALDAGMVELLSKLGAGVHERRAWRRAFAETSPLQPQAHPDRLLKLHHLYLSDDRRDLVGMAGDYYREDIEHFGYSFPSNDTLLPWEAGGALRHRLQYAGARMARRHAASDRARARKA